MKNSLNKLFQIVKLLNKLLPVLIEVIGDLADDGQVNDSIPKPKTKAFFKAKPKKL
mgnify:CR=1 FL=1